MTLEKVERLQELFEQGYAIDFESDEDVWERCLKLEPIDAYEIGDRIRIAKKEQEYEVNIQAKASRKYYTEELV
jgi:regulator of sirC expression with transglutaminase-like and TPR domain